MRRRVVEAPAYPEPPVHLQRCVVEELLSPEAVRAARAENRDLLAAAFLAQRDGLRIWAVENNVPWQETSRYRARPRYRRPPAQRSGQRR